MIDEILLDIEQSLSRVLTQDDPDRPVKVLTLQHVNEETFTTGLSFDSVLVVLSYRGTTPGNPVDREPQILIPDSHEFSVYVAVKSDLPRTESPNYVRPLAFLKIVRDVISSKIPKLAHDRPYLARQQYISNLTGCRCALYEQQWEVQANYVILEEAYEPELLKEVRFIGVTPPEPNPIANTPNN